MLGDLKSCYNVDDLEVIVLLEHLNYCLIKMLGIEYY